MVYARNLMATNYQNLTKSNLGKLKCLPVYPFMGTLLAHLAGLAAGLHRHSHTSQSWGMQLCSRDFRAGFEREAQWQGQQAEEWLPSYHSA